MCVKYEYEQCTRIHLVGSWLNCQSLYTLDGGLWQQKTWGTTQVWVAHGLVPNIEVFVFVHTEQDVPAPKCDVK